MTRIKTKQFLSIADRLEMIAPKLSRQSRKVAIALAKDLRQIVEGAERMRNHRSL